ncbi:MAG: glycine betaine ABC transporter substrate-binding protein [Candidatus Eiseniibacteriota bacterium]|jgi:osmoprotectant transport system permease protein
MRRALAPGTGKLVALVVTLFLLASATVSCPVARADASDASDASDPDLPPRPAGTGRVVVGSKNFAENRLLAEMFAQLIEQRTGLEVVRRLSLAGTTVCFEALRNGAIDLYPEYTGTGLVTLLGEEPGGDAAATLRRVRRTFLERWNLWWLAPLGFENAYELAVPRELAEQYGLRTISDLARVAPQLRAGFGYEFVERRDGLPGLRDTYGLEFASVRQMQQALKYASAGERRIDCLDVYTTDGRLLVHDLVVLDDDKHFFPPYAAAALVRGTLLERHPEVGAVLGLLSGALDEETMRGLNLRLQEHGEAVPVVAADALAMLGLGAAPSGETPRTAAADRLLPYLWAERRALLGRLGEHLALSALALALGALIAVPTGMALERRRGLAEGFIRVIGVTQTIPSLALLAFMIPLFGIGTLPAVVALWIYSIFPILRNTFTGLRDADPQAVEAAGALGMTGRQVLIRVRLPLAASVIMAGVRTAGVITIGTATLAAFIGAGGLGVPIVSGLQLANTTMILSGALPAALLAIVVDLGLGGVERLLRPRGIVESGITR